MGARTKGDRYVKIEENTGQLLIFIVFVLSSADECSSESADRVHEKKKKKEK